MITRSAFPVALFMPATNENRREKLRVQVQFGESCKEVRSCSVQSVPPGGALGQCDSYVTVLL